MPTILPSLICHTCVRPFIHTFMYMCLFLRIVSLKVRSHCFITLVLDAERLVQSWSIHAVWLAPVMTAAVIAIGWIEIGPSILAGAGFMLALLPLQLFFGRQFAKLRRKTAVCTDARVSTMKVMRFITVALFTPYDTDPAFFACCVVALECKMLLHNALHVCRDGVCANTRILLNSHSASI